MLYQGSVVAVVTPFASAALMFSIIALAQNVRENRNLILGITCIAHACFIIGGFFMLAPVSLTTLRCYVFYLCHCFVSRIRKGFGYFMANWALGVVVLHLSLLGSIEDGQIGFRRWLTC